MSDVPARCTRCGNEIRVSEFIDPEALKCPNCGSPLVLDKATGERAGMSRLTVRREKPPDPPTPEQVAASKSKGGTIFRRKHRQGRMRKLGGVHISDFAISWVIFFTLTPVLCLLRYVQFLPDSDLADYIYGGQIAFALFYLVTVIAAFSEDMFDGILCFFLPPYTVYYLFFKSDSFSLRALIVALFAAFGYDVTMTVYKTAVWAIVEAQRWIGGGALGY